MGTNTNRAEVSANSVSSALVLRKLENAILSGYFKPRERLVERDLLAHFDVSLYGNKRRYLKCWREKV